MLKKTIQLFFTIVIMWFIFTHITFSEVKEVFLSLRYSVILASMFLYFLVYVLRAYRFGLFLENNNFFSLFHLVSKNSFFNIALPFKFGDLALAPMIKKSYNKSLTGGVGVLLLVRIYDLFAVVLLFTFSCVFFFNQNIYRYLFFTAFCLLILMVVLLTKYQHKTLLLVHKIIGLFGGVFNLKQKKMYVLFLKKVDELFESFSVVTRSHINIKVMLSSILIWLGLYAVYFIALLDGGLNAPFILFIFGCSFAFFANALPLSVFGSWGIQEAGWAAGFILVGLPKELALATGVTTHILVTIYSMVTFITTYLIKRLSKFV